MDSLNHLQEMFEEYGRLDGLEQGKRQGFLQGRELGVEKGLALGQEVGFMQAVSSHYLRLVQICPSKFSSRSEKQLLQLMQLIEQFPMTNDGLDPHEELIRLRGKYKACMSLVGSHHLYQDGPKLSF